MKQTPLRVLHFIGSSLDRGGVQTWLMEVFRSIDRTKVQFDIVVGSDAPGQFDDEFKSLGGRIFYAGNRHHLVKYLFACRRILREQGPYQAVHAHIEEFSGFLLHLAKFENVPLLLVHSHSNMAVVNNSASASRRLYLGTMRRLIRSAMHVGLAGSSESATSLFGYGWQRDRRIAILRYGINVKPYRSSMPNQLRQDLNLPPDSFIVGHIGRFAPEKNHRFILELAKRVRERTDRIVFVCIGDGELRQQFEADITEERLGEVIADLRGPRPNVPSLLMEVVDLLILPSVYEGLPLVTIEAQAAGLPLILSDSVTKEAIIIPGMVDHMPLTDPECWAERIIALATTENRERNRAALKIVEESQFNIENSVRNLQTIYETGNNGSLRGR